MHNIHSAPVVTSIIPKLSQWFLHTLHLISNISVTMFAVLVAVMSISASTHRLLGWRTARRVDVSAAPDCPADEWSFYARIAVRASRGLGSLLYAESCRRLPNAPPPCFNVNSSCLRLGLGSVFKDFICIMDESYVYMSYNKVCSIKTKDLILLKYPKHDLLCCMSPERSRKYQSCTNQTDDLRQ